MAYEAKMKPTDANPAAFLEETLADQPRKREEAHQLLALYREVTGHPPVMWGPSIIGYGAYRYKYASGHAGIAPLTGFSPRKARFSPYFAFGDPELDALLDSLGKIKRGKACVYVNKLTDIDLDVLRKAIRRSVAYWRELYPDD